MDRERVEITSPRSPAELRRMGAVVLPDLLVAQEYAARHADFLQIAGQTAIENIQGRNYAAGN